MKKLIFYYFFFLLSLFLILSSGVIDSQDGFQYLAVARNIYYTGKPTAPVYEYDREKNVHMSTYVGKDGYTYSPTGLGYSLAMLPAVAITDLVYKIYHVSPLVHFPLENDWLILMLASFTNAFFAALLGVIILLYLLELGLSKKQAIFISFVGLFTTNLLVYTKHSFAHMMFTTFLFLSFFLVKKYFQTKMNIWLILSGIAFGITAITYNQTFLLSVIPLGLYFVLIGKFKLNLALVRFLSSKFLLFFVGLLPFIIIYLWFENLRASAIQNLINPLTVVSRGIDPVKNLPVTVFLEGLYGQLFSPGRSILLYSPILLLIIFFWHKIKKVIFPELLVFLLLSIIYILFYATQYSIGAPTQGTAGLWHGESSWGPRYLAPLIPFGLLIVGFIFTRLKKAEKIFVVFPLLFLGFYVEMLGVIMPYQIKLYELQGKFFVNSTEYTSFVYSNLLPRYSPVIMMSKKLIKLTENFPKTYDHGIYNVKFYDGIGLPFNVGLERWRVLEGDGYISFDNSDKNQVSEISFGLINHPVSGSSASASLQLFLNDKPLLNNPFRLAVTERNLLRVPTKKELIKDKDNRLVVQVRFDDPKVQETKGQILGLQYFEINRTRINMESIDVPYVSLLGSKIAGVTYRNWGGTNRNPWKTWDIHTQTFERLPDLWWLRNLYYWDIPKTWILIPFAINIAVLILAGVKLRKNL